MIITADEAAIASDREFVRRRGLYEFIRRAWPQVEAADFKDNWHVGAIAEHLQACAENQIQRLIINVPPGSTKSLSAAVLFPAWVWTTTPVEERFTQGPATKFHYLSYNHQLSLRDADKHKTLIQSPWFQQRWGGPEGVKITKDPVAYFWNNHRGFRLTVTMRGGSTGQHAHVQCVDDPIKPEDTQGTSDVTRKMLKRVEDLWSGTLATRSCDANYFVRIIIMQRLHDADLCGSELERGGYTHLMIPLRFEPKRAYSTGVGKWPKDPRTEDGQLLDPCRMNEEQAKKREDELGSHASAQLQQDPVPTTGGIFERDWLKLFWSFPGDGYIPGTIPLPPLKEMSTCLSWDMAFKGKADSDRVAGGAWGRHRARYFLLDQVCDRWSFTQSLDAVRTFADKWPRITRKLVEDKANGTAVVDVLQDDIAGFELVEPEGGKEARAWACSPIAKSGCLVLPHPSMAGYGWVKAYIEELARFPKAPNDDMVDQTSQALNYLKLHAPKWVTAMAARIEAEKAAQKPDVSQLVIAPEPVQEAPKADVEGLKARLSAALRLNG